MKTVLKKSLLLSLTMTLLPACVTFSGKKGQVKVKDTLENAVVVKQGSLSPIKSNQSRKHWIDLRHEQKNTIQKIQGLLATGEFIAAERHARKLLERNPGNEATLIALASSLALSGQHSLGAYYGKVLEKTFPNNSATLNFLGIAKMMTATKVKDYDDAKEYFQRSLDNSNTEVAAGLNLGYLQIAMGDANSASHTFATVSERCPSCLDSALGEGIALARLKKFDAAKSKFKRATKLDKKNANAYYYLALSQKATGEHDKAEKNLRKVLGPNILATNSIRDQAQSVLRKMKSIDHLKSAASSDNQWAQFDEDSNKESVASEDDTAHSEEESQAPATFDTSSDIEVEVAEEESGEEDFSNVIDFED